MVSACRDGAPDLGREDLAIMKLEQNNARLGEQVERWISTIKDSQSRTMSDGRVLDTPDWWKPEGLDPDVEKAIHGFRLSNQMLTDLGDAADGPTLAGNVFVVALGVILDLLPPLYVQEQPTAEERRRPVQVFLDDLYAQLARGKVQISVARLVFAVPVGLVSSMALRDTETLVTLPLPTVVASVGDAGLLSRTAGRPRQMNLHDFPELFTASQSVPPPAPPVVMTVPTVEPVAEAEAPLPVATTEVELLSVANVTAAPEVTAMASVETIDALPPSAALAPEPVPAPVAVPVQDAAPAPASAVPETPTYVSALALERLNGVDLNTADEAQLRTLCGVTPRVAAAILAYRRERGPFGDVFALANVPGVGRETFRKITGMPHSRTGRTPAEALIRCLGVDRQAAGQLPSLVRAIRNQSGLKGCVVSDRDGLLLAESGVGDEAGVWSAVIPRLFARMGEDLAVLGSEGVGAVSLWLGGRFVTISVSGDLYLTAVHASSRLSLRLQTVLRRVTHDLAWLLSHRGYVSIASTDEGGSAQPCSMSNP